MFIVIIIALLSPLASSYRERRVNKKLNIKTGVSLVVVVAFIVEYEFHTEGKSGAKESLAECIYINRDISKKVSIRSEWFME